MSGHQAQSPHYRGWVIASLVFSYVIACAFFILELAVGGVASGNTDTPSTTSPGILGTLSILLILIVHGFILALDGRNFISLFHRLNWKQLRAWQRIGLGLIYLMMFVIPAVYFGFAIQRFLAERRQTFGDILNSTWKSYRAKSRARQITLGMITALLLVTFVGLTSIFAAVDRENAHLLATPTSAPIAASNIDATSPSTLIEQSPTSIPTDIPTQKPTPTPTAKPSVAPLHPSQPTPAPTHAPQPTHPPQPTPTHPSCSNPWCYDFNPGALIYYPPNGFCNYFNCIASFYGSDDPGDGYVVQCTDGTFSQSGGERGACSYHGGVSRPLYSH